MLQSGLTRLKSVFNGSSEQTERERPPRGHVPNARSASVGLRPESISGTRQILHKKMSVPVPLSSLGHAPLQMSRSVPAYPRHSPGCPAHSETHHQVSGHRKLARSGLVTPGEMQRLQRVRRERARSASALVRPEPQHHGGKRRKQDHNRNVYNNERDSLSVSSSETNPEDHIYEEIDSDFLATEEETEDNFLLSISLQRQRNLKFYGSAGWDFGSVS